MEELFDSLFDGEIAENGIQEVSDINVDDAVNTDADIINAENLGSGTQFIDNTFDTSGLIPDESQLFSDDPIISTTDGAEYMLSETGVVESSMSAVTATAVVDDFGTNVEDGNFLSQVDLPDLDVPEDDIEALRDRASGLDREVLGNEISFGKKVCPTRHGCTGATYCDSCGSDYPY